MLDDAEEAPIKVLYVEDDARLASLTSRYLQSHELLVTVVDDGEKALAELARRQYDCVLLDVQLPTLDGMTVCRHLRERSDIPVIVITARDEEQDRIDGFDAGADDYMGKPFSSRELLSRIRAVVRRARRQVGPSEQVVTVGLLSMHPGRKEAYLDEALLPLTSHEFALLLALARNAGTSLSREQLLDLALGGAEAAFDRSVDVHISRLRNKLGDDDRRIVKTVRGSGYMLAVKEK